MGVLDTLGKASPKTRSVTMCVDGALQAKWDALSAQLEDAVDTDSATDEGSLALPATTKIVNEMEAIREEVAASEVTFVFRKMNPWERIALQAEHPPQEIFIDKLRGFHAATFYPILIAKSCISVTDTSGDTSDYVPQEIWDNLLGRPAIPATDDEPEVPAVVGSLNLGQVDRLVQAAEAVNNGATQVPISARSLLKSQDSGASLAQPSPGTSAPVASTAGSQPTSPSTSTTKQDG